MTGRALLCGAVLLGCAGAGGRAGSGAGDAAVSPRRAPGTVYARIPDELATFKLTQRAAIQGAPADSIYRFRDGTRANVSVIVYDPAPEDKAGRDPQRWVMYEGEKFKEIQALRQQRGELASFTISVADTTRVPAGDLTLLEHRIVTPVRYRNGVIAVDMQFLYVVDEKFVKVRATLPQDGWQQSQAPIFARALAGRLGAP